MSKVYILSKKEPQDIEWKVVGVVKDYFVASAWVSGTASKTLHKWESAEFNAPELLNLIAKGNSYYAKES